MKKTWYRKIQTILFWTLTLLSAFLLLYLWLLPNVKTEETRRQAEYETVQDVTYEKAEDGSSPSGVVRKFCFFLTEEIMQDTTLMFEFSHQYAKVYLGDTLVYSLQHADELSIIQTPGTNWAMIPLYREDIGKEVRVVLTPVYENYQDQKIDFLIGSKLAVYMKQLKKSAVEIILSMIDMIVGLVLLCAAVYFSGKKVENRGFYALAMLAVSLGLWNFTQTDFAPLILREKTVFSYYLSLIMLLICVLSLIKSVRVSENRKKGDLLEVWCILCSGVCIAQLLLQLTGRCDMRQMLKLTHGMIVISSLMLIANGIMETIHPTEQGWKEKRKGIWLIGIGALIDLILYYARKTSSGLFFVLIAIFIYALTEVIQMFFVYARQTQMLEEKETQLTLSRTMTMMSQIRSHFVFNILNAISGMCKYNPEKADETIVRFARYLRNNIDIMEDDRPNLFSVELEHLEDYVVLEQVRFGDKIEFYADVKTEEFRIPPLILQPIVENAIKHGLVKKPEGGTVILRTWEEGEMIKISIEDDGVGFTCGASDSQQNEAGADGESLPYPAELEKRKSIGLKNIRYRLYHLMHGTITMESQPGVGTKVTIAIPKEEARRCGSYI